jgi:hypothetical protein
MPPIKIVRHRLAGGMREKRRTDCEIEKDQIREDFHRAAVCLGDWPTQQGNPV